MTTLQPFQFKWLYGLTVRRPETIIADDLEVYDMREWHSIFSRLNNREGRLYAEDMIKAGYPYVDIGPHTASSPTHWGKLHKLCEEQFVNGQGKLTYLWFGNKFFFTNKDDADLFRGLLYML